MSPGRKSDALRILSISSGSSGNCIYVGKGNTHLLVDAGISAKRIEEGLNTIGLKTSDMDAVLITHEHSDHIGGLDIVSKKYGLPIYATKGTMEGILKVSKKPEVTRDLFNVIRADNGFLINDIYVDPIRISHDALEPVCYRFYDDPGQSGSDRDSAAVCTDLGTYDDYIIDRLKGVSSLLLEANHDIRMLEAGPYPYFLKKRISGDRGHLSNDSAGLLLSELMKSKKLKSVLLGHLSQENNYAALAYETVRMQLKLCGIECGSSEGSGVYLGIAPRDVPGKLMESI